MKKIHTIAITDSESDVPANESVKSQTADLQRKFGKPDFAKDVRENSDYTLDCANTAFQKQVLHSLTVIKTRLKHVEETQEILLQRHMDGFSKRKWRIELPLRNIEDVQALESTLSNDEYFDELSARIKSLGGTCVGDCTRR
ncbi:unnamed protein product, partial [Allacma fusca]